MYVTRPLSSYRKDPSALSLPPPEGPNSGYLVIFDEEAETTCCFGFCKNRYINRPPFPQNKDLTVQYTTSSGHGVIVLEDSVLFIPVLNQPLSSNRYYVIRRKGKHKGEASTSSKEENMGTFLCCSYVRNVKPKPLDPSDIYQQIEIISERCGFHAKSVAPDGFPPEYLRRKGWRIYYKTPRNYHLSEALGVNSSLRAGMPDFNFQLTQDCSESVVVGKWYTPFMFVKEGMGLKDQMKMSVYYEITLEQKWEKVFSKDNDDENSKEKTVVIDVVVQRDAAVVGGREAVWDERNVNDGVLWFRSIDCVGEEASVGLSFAIVERMKWEQERVGWVSGDKNQARLEKVEEFRGNEGWKRFGCYVLVESFVFKRMDGSSILKYDFKHMHQVMCKWE